MTGQAKGTNKLKVQILPVHLGILLWDLSFFQRDVYYFKSELIHMTQSPSFRTDIRCFSTLHLLIREFLQDGKGEADLGMK